MNQARREFLEGIAGITSGIALFLTRMDDTVFCFFQAIINLVVLQFDCCLSCQQPTQRFYMLGN